MKRPNGLKNLHRRYQRHQEKLQAKKQRKIFKDGNSLFEVEPLEQRTLLSADPLLGAGSTAIILNDNENKYQETQTIILDDTLNDKETVVKDLTTENSSFLLDAKLLDLNNISELFIDDEILAGSGTIEADVINHNIVAPGYSPGIQNITGDYTQASDGTLQIELSGTDNSDTNNPEYDQLNASGNVELDGTLEITMWNDFAANVGDEFTIITGSNITGKFTDITGLYGFNSDYYFDIEQTSTEVKLITKELVSGDDFNFVLDSVPQYDEIGKVLNADYLVSAQNSIELNDIDIQVAGFAASGNFAIEKNTNTIEIIGSGVSVTMSASDVFVGVENADLGIIVDSNKKVALEASGDIVLDGFDFDLPTAQSVSVKLNQTGTEYTAQTLTIGTSSYTFDNIASSTTLKEIGITGLDVTFSDNIVLKGDFAFVSDTTNNVFNAISSNATAYMSAGDFYVGVSSANLGLMVTDEGVVLQANGALDVSLGSDIVLSATNVSFDYNETATDYLNETISLGASTFTFNVESLHKATNITNGSLNVFDFLTASGNFSFSQSTDTVTLSDSTNSSVELLTLGMTNVTAFAGLNANSSEKIGFDLSNLDLALVFAADTKNNARKWTALQASTNSISFVGSDKLTIEATFALLEINRSAIDGTLIDFKLNPLTIEVGTDSLSLTMDASEGELLRVSGDMLINISDFFIFEGSVYFSKSTTSVTLTDDSVVSVDNLTLAMNGVDAFAGLDGQSSNKVGLDLEGVSFAYSIMANKSDATQKWTSFKAKATGASFVGIDDVTIDARDILVNVNTSSNTEFVDYSKTSYSVDFQNGNSIEFDMDSEIIELSADITFNLYDFLVIDGGFAIKKSTLDDVILSDESLVDVDLLTVGANNLTAFAGLNYGKTDEVGLSLSGVSFALSVMSEKTVNKRKWLALQATAQDAGLVGIDDLVLNGSDLNILINQASSDGTLVDFSSMSFAVDTSSSTSITLDMDGSVGEYLKVSGHFDVNVYNFFSTSGNFALEKTTDTVSLDNGDNVNVDLLTIGADSVDAFVGVNGGSSDAIGIQATNTNFALAILNDKTVGSNSQWISLQATVGTAGFVGIDGLSLSASNLDVQINRSSETGSDARYVDYAINNLEVATGTDSSFNLTMDGSQKELTQISGAMDINIFNFFSVNGEFALKKYTDYDIKTVDKDDSTNTGTIEEVDVLTLGALGANAFIGMNGGSDEALGLSAAGVNFALAIINNKSNKNESFTSLQATTSNVSFVGIEDLTVSATDLALNINQGSSTNKVVDYKTMEDNGDAFDVLVGTNQTVTLDMDGSRGELLEASGHLELNLFNFIGLEGNFGFEKSVREVTLNSGESIKVDYLGLGGENVSAFAGLNYKQADAVGLSLGDMDFGLALMSDKKDNTRKFTSLQATASSAGLIGVDGLVIEASDLEVYINQGIKVDEIPDSTIKENTILKVSITEDIRGDVVITKDGSNETLNIDGSETNDTLIAELKAAFASLASTDAVNVEVSGDKVNGYKVEFVGALEGTNVEGFTISTTAPSASVSISTIEEAKAGVDEITRLTIDTPRVVTAPIDTEIFTLTNTSSGTNEIQTITFHDPYDAGTYTLSNGVTSVSVKFVGSQTLTNQTNIQKALVTLYGGTTADYKVKFDSSSSGSHKYYITFQGTKAHSNVSELSATPDSNMKAISTSTYKEGTGTVGEVQHFKVSTTATGNYTLSLDYNGNTYTTTALDFNATANEIQTALTNALSTISGATVSVVDCVAGYEDSFDVTFGGTLSGVDLPLLSIKTNPDATSPSGTFDIWFEGDSKQTVAYSTDMSVLASNIQAALEATSTMGAGNVVVEYDATNSNETQINFLIKATGDLEKTDVSDKFYTDDSNLNLASTKLYYEVEGYSDTAEEQKLVFNSETEYSYTLTYNGQTTSSILSSATISEIQAIIDSELTSDIKVSNFNGTELVLSFEGSLAGTDVETIVASVEAKTSEAKIEVSQEGSTTVIAGKEASAIVVDYKAMNEVDVSTEDDFKVLSGTGSYFTLDMDGSVGEYLRVTGNLEIDVFGAVKLDGGFALEKYTKSDVLLSDNTTVNTDMLTFGISDANGLVGYDQGTEDKADDVGLILSDVDFALAILSDKTVASTQKWITANATVGSVSFGGISGLGMSVSNLNISVNKESANKTVIDYKIDENDTTGTELSVLIGTDNKSIDFNMAGSKGDFLEVAGQATIDLFGVVKVDGGFAVSKSANQTVYLAKDGKEQTGAVDTELMTIGLTGANALVGYDQGTEATTDDVGLLLQDVDLAVAMMKEKSGTRSWTTVQANVGSVSFQGVPGLTMSVDKTNVLVNKQATDSTVVNYLTSDTDTLGTDLSVAVGTDENSETQYVDFNLDGTRGDFLEVAGQATIDLFGVVKVD
ncbi:beta strand repeat-containing protein, partial [Arcobacter sp. YIC-464]|uniref:beta strand repeat-containing protein n=1 Tax=Arcobacter sp. YIC-464 TaxID=3376631 RepID=UPI003C2F5B95